MTEEQRTVKRKVLPIRGWLAVITELLALRLLWALPPILNAIEVLANAIYRQDRMYFLLALLDTVIAIIVVVLYFATLRGLLQGDRRFRKYFTVLMAIRMATWLVQGIAYGSQDAFGEVFGIAVWDGLMLLYFHKSQRVQAGYFGEAEASASAEEAA
ncbi:MAG: DUF2569 family protein [Oscillospiraceae bacterium]|jgi:hypothetical protein|nr:DUF2569 family protein [Oscillospiraceae bacterium]